MEIELDKIARLAKIRIEPEKRETFEKQMRDIIGMVERLDDTDDPYTGVDESNPMRLRADEVRPSLPRKGILQNAPQTQAGCVVVPRTVE